MDTTTVTTCRQLQRTTILKQICVDYTPDACHHSPDVNAIHICYDHRGGARWRTPHRFLYGAFSAHIKSPAGDTSGLNFNLYLSSLEGDKAQDEIDFEFLGRDKGIVQTNFYVDGVGGKEVVHDLGFDSGEDFHEYLIRWEEGVIEWEVDGKVLRREEKREGVGFPAKPMFLYASVWDASYIDEGRWTGAYVGTHAPYVCWYKDVKVPSDTAVVDE